ncbi:hypothetical protein KIN20_035857 [Parelaphostrongylus tenuis]|uniref:Uncharacterized protein n=1 Tax=Parelaphostrongylus tenuis TaxID=148309 RepID=A0AAD5RCA2_PARTN|nr:hypothetical protein KIN20_035857 [Parelaphostrongylus tenuis]
MNPVTHQLFNVLDRKNQRITVAGLHNTEIKTTDIAKIGWFQISRSLQSRETFQRD